jgi:hypothetical protein
MFWKLFCVTFYLLFFESQLKGTFLFADMTCYEKAIQMYGEKKAFDSGDNKSGYGAGWPDLANFRLLGDCILYAVFLKIAETAHIFWATFYHINFGQKWVKIQFGPFFQKLIWSPCSCSNARILGLSKRISQSPLLWPLWFELRVSQLPTSATVCVYMKIGFRTSQCLKP